MSFTQAIPVLMMMFSLVVSGFFIGVIFLELLKTRSDLQAREDLSKLSNEELSALIIHGRPGSQRSIMAIDEMIERKRAIEREVSKLMEHTK